MHERVVKVFNKTMQEWRANGTLKESTDIINAATGIIRVRQYSDDGTTIKLETFYKKGLKFGVETQYYPSGNKYEESIYDEEKYIGPTTTYWDKPVEVLKFRCGYEDKIIWTEDYDEEGRLKVAVFNFVPEGKGRVRLRLNVTRDSIEGDLRTFLMGKIKRQHSATRRK